MIVSTIVLLLAWDMYAYENGGRAATITDVVQTWCKHRAVVLAFGILIGHLILG